MLVKTKFIVCCFSLWLSVANASGTYLDHSEIELLTQTPDDIYFRGIGNTGNNPDGCQSTNESNYAIIPDSHPKQRELYAMLLAAQISHREVSVYVSDCHTRWGSEFPEVVTIHLN
jgi:hypothetical protein